jgi:tetratricopeptide (TPR) repeat protein
MKKKKEKTLMLIALILLFTVTANPTGLAQHEHMHDEHPIPEGSSIGDIDFKVSCDETVRENFDYALGMLHHMMYASSRAAFEKIIEDSPDCAMPYWGVATTLFQPLWGTRPDEEDLHRGWQNIEKARELVNSEREKYLIESTAQFFRNPEADEFWVRMERWADGLETAYQAYPDDPDIAAFYGLSLLAIAQRVENKEPLYDKAEDVLRAVFERFPAHPGAIHYSIHATDVDGRAENALDMVEKYSEIAPEVPHALHMPSHIYVRLGDWSKVIEWNHKSARAALEHPVNGAESHHYIHAIDYLIYAWLQQGQDAKAESYFEKAWNKDRYQQTIISAYHLAAIPARIAVEQRDWEKAASLEPRTPEYLPWSNFHWPEGLVWFARGLGAVHTGNIEEAIKSEQHLRRLRDGANEADKDAMAKYIEIDRRILAGQIAHAQGDDSKALELMRSSGELEVTVEKHPVTPGALLPPYEALGDLLMELDRPAEALEAYKASGDIWPERYNTLLGAAQAAAEAGMDETAKRFYEKLLANAGDSDRSNMEEAKNYLSQEYQ